MGRLEIDRIQTLDASVQDREERWQKYVWLQEGMTHSPRGAHSFFPPLVTLRHWRAQSGQNLRSQVVLLWCWSQDSTDRVWLFCLLHSLGFGVITLDFWFFCGFGSTGWRFSYALLSGANWCTNFVGASYLWWLFFMCGVACVADFNLVSTTVALHSFFWAVVAKCWIYIFGQVYHECRGTDERSRDLFK